MARKEKPNEGNFHHAIAQLLTDLRSSSFDNEEMLRRWDQARGRDWYVATSDLRPLMPNA